VSHRHPVIVHFIILYCTDVAMPPALLFVLWITLAISGILWFHTNFSSDFYFSLNIPLGLW
jgi:hypothetical protein